MAALKWIAVIYVSGAIATAAYIASIGHFNEAYDYELTLIGALLWPVLLPLTLLCWLFGIDPRIN